MDLCGRILYSSLKRLFCIIHSKTAEILFRTKCHSPFICKCEGFYGWEEGFRTISPTSPVPFIQKGRHTIILQTDFSHYTIQKMDFFSQFFEYFRVKIVCQWLSTVYSTLSKKNGLSPPSIHYLVIIRFLHSKSNGWRDSATIKNDNYKYIIYHFFVWISFDVTVNGGYFMYVVVVWPNHFMWIGSFLKCKCSKSKCKSSHQGQFDRSKFKDENVYQYIPSTACMPPNLRKIIWSKSIRRWKEQKKKTNMKNWI